MTVKIFWQDPYLTELATTVKTVNSPRITVAETIFYAFSGGQESDYGVRRAWRGSRRWKSAVG
jgi:Ser-tRNA(Ala) deacylase AlaX